MPPYEYMGVERRSHERRKLDSSANTSALTPRERQVLKLLAEGKGSKEIALTLGISETTVKTHRNHVKEKLALGNTASLVRFAIKVGLVEP